MPSLAAPSAIWKRMKEIRATYAVEPMKTMQQRMSMVTNQWMERTSTFSKVKRSYSNQHDDTERVRTPSYCGNYHRKSKSEKHMVLFEASTDLQSYELLGILGRGTFGVVYLARHKRTNKSVAIKILPQHIIIDMKQETNISREQSVHLLLDHPFVSRLYTTFQDANALYFVLEYCPGGELYSLVYEDEENEDNQDDEAHEVTESESDEEEREDNNRPRRDTATAPVKSMRLDNSQAKKALKSTFGGLEEAHVAFYLACLMLGLEYLHSMNILYRDLKLENLVLDHEGYPKLVDFGLSKPDAADNDRNTTMCGSMEYMAPEVLQRQPYDQRADLWSFGIIMYELLFGATPFYHCNRREQGRRITVEPVSFPETFEAQYPEATALINQLLAKNPADRPTSFQECKDSAFFCKYFPTAQAWRQLEARTYVNPVTGRKVPFVPRLANAFDHDLFPKWEDEVETE